jgi:hypothetical protein
MPQKLKESFSKDISEARLNKKAIKEPAVSWKVLTGNVSGIAVSEVENLPIFKTKKEIRRTLHPEYSADDINNSSVLTAETPELS